MIMKKILNSLFVIVASMVTFAGCQKEENNAPASQTKTVEFFANSIETKTHFADKTADNKYPTLWDAGDKVKVLMNLEKPTGISGLEATSEALTASDILNDGASARFKVELNDGTPDEQGDVYTSDSYTYYAVVPSSAYYTKSDADGGRVTVTIPIAQTPQPNALDKAAQIIYAVSEAYPSIQDAVSLDFKHFTAYGKFSLTNLTNQIGTIKTVALKFDGVNIAGKWNYYPSTDTKGVQEAGSNTITLTTSSATDIWFACAPVDVSGKKLTVTVTDVDGKQLVKEVTMSANRVFESGKVSTFTVNMNGIVPPVQEENAAYYEKVTTAPADWTGAYLMVCESKSKALSGISTTSTKYGIGSDVTISNDKKILAATVDSGWQILISKATVTSNSYRIKFANQYLYWNSGNSLQTNATESEKTNWTISLSNGNVTIVNCSDNTRVIGWNASSPRFACYTSTQTAIQLYKLVDGDAGTDTPEPDQPSLTPRNLAFSSSTATATMGQAFTALTLTGAKVDDVTYSSSNTAVATVNASTGAVTLVGAGSTTITATAPESAEYEAGTASYILTVSPAQGGGESTTSVTVTKSISSYGFTNEQKVTEIKLDDVVTAKLSGGSNTGKYYTNGSNWRLYQTESASITISVSSEYTIKSVKVTYSNSNNGVLMKNSTNVSSGTTDTVNANSVTYKVGNTGSATNGQVRITAIEVVYQK